MNRQDPEGKSTWLRHMKTWSDLLVFWGMQIKATNKYASEWQKLVCQITPSADKERGKKKSRKQLRWLWTIPAIEERNMSVLSNISGRTQMLLLPETRIWVPDFWDVLAKSEVGGAEDSAPALFVWAQPGQCWGLGSGTLLRRDRLCLRLAESLILGKEKASGLTTLGILMLYTIH